MNAPATFPVRRVMEDRQRITALIDALADYSSKLDSKNWRDEDHALLRAAVEAKAVFRNADFSDEISELCAELGLTTEGFPLNDQGDEIPGADCRIPFLRGDS